MTREKYEKRFTDSAIMVQQRDVEVAELKVGEAASLTTQNAGLLEKVSALELERDGLKGQVSWMPDMDNQLYPHMLTAIASRRWVVRHGFRLSVHKCARSLECRSTL
ncbi:hypothetical protein Tco_0254776, partial [Tanacetum coccineum]